MSRAKGPKLCAWCGDLGAHIRKRNLDGEVKFFHKDCWKMAALAYVRHLQALAAAKEKFDVRSDSGLLAPPSPVG